jgi:hypothetical protein
MNYPKIFFLMFILALSGYAQTSPVPKIVSSGVVNGKAISLPKPEYAKAALDTGVSGEIKVQVVIDERGNVASATAISGPELLRDAAVAAALQAKFDPTFLAGKAVKVSGIIVYKFAPPNYENKAKLILVGVFLNFPDFIDIPDVEDMPSATIGEEMARELPNLAEELKPLNALKTMEKGKRASFLAEIAAKVEPKLSESDKWQYGVGKGLGRLMGEMYKFVFDHKYQIKESVLLTNLLELKESAKRAPADYPPAIVSKMAELGKLADRENLTSQQNLELIASATQALMEVISPDSDK